MLQRTNLSAEEEESHDISMGWLISILYPHQSSHFGLDAPINSPPAGCSGQHRAAACSTARSVNAA